MRKLTSAQLRNLAHVRDFGKPVPRTNAAYHCRMKDLSEFVWEFGDGSIATARDQIPSEQNGWLSKIVGERLTAAGRAALEAEGRSNV